METILTVLSFAAFGVVTLFIVVFAREPWWRHPFGQSVMTLSVALWMLTSLGILRIQFGEDYAARPYLLGGGRLLVVLAMSQRVFVLLREQRADREPR